jgi:hypothetical protein
VVEPCASEAASSEVHPRERSETVRYFTALFGISIAAALLAGCAGAPLMSAQSAPQAQQRASSQCPCLYVADPIYNGSTNKPRIIVYAQGASGDVKPMQEITGSNTGLSYPIAVAVDKSGDIYAVNYMGEVSGSGHLGSITVYAPGATGNVSPTATIGGQRTGLFGPQGIAIDPVNGDIYVANEPTGSDPAIGSSEEGTILIYSPGSKGNVSPLGKIHGSATELGDPFGLTFDSAGNLYVASVVSGSETDSVAVFAAGSSGNVAPTRFIQGDQTELEEPTQVALDSSLNTYVVNHAGKSVTVYAAGANGNVAPIRRITGDRTKLNYPFGAAVDSDGNVYVTNTFTLKFMQEASKNKGSVTVYAAGANGNRAPLRKIQGPNTGLAGPNEIEIH